MFGLEKENFLCQKPCLDRTLRESVRFRMLVVKGTLIPRAWATGLWHFKLTLDLLVRWASSTGVASV